jgi:hypothetical protein
MKVVVLRSHQSVELVACQNGGLTPQGRAQWRYAVRADAKVTEFTPNHGTALSWYRAITGMRPVEASLLLGAP